MQNMNDMINMMPQIQRQQKMPAQAPGSGDMTNFLSLQMMVGRELQSTQRLHQDLAQLIKDLQNLIDKNDTPGFTEAVASNLQDLGDRLENPVINMDFPTEELVNVKKAIQALKFESKDTLSVTNLSEVTKVINELKPFLVNLEQAISDSKSEVSENVVLDKESKGYLKKLENLDTDAKNPLAVRLSDGKEFYKGIGQLNDGIRAMTGSSGNNFLTSTGNPTKANLDEAGNLLVSISSAQTPKFAVISCSSSGNNEIVAAVATKKIRVLNYSVISNGTVNAKWRSASTDKSGLLYLIANVGASPAYSPVGQFETVAGEALNINLSGAVAIGGHLTYVEVS